MPRWQALRIRQVLLMGLLMDPWVVDLDFVGLEGFLLLGGQQRSVLISGHRLDAGHHLLLLSLLECFGGRMGGAPHHVGVGKLADRELLDVLSKI